MSGNSQRFIARNRAPRVQIEYDVELYGSQKSVQLPFVMGVMSDLSGKSNVPQPGLEDRQFLEIDVDNFDSRMKAMAPRAAFSVPNTLTGEGNLEVDLTFEKLDDFTPTAIAQKIEPLRALFEARTQLANLMAYMDGKAGAEALIEKILNDPSLLSALSQGKAPEVDTDAALAALRDAAPEDAPPDDGGAEVLDALRANAPPDAPPETDQTEAVLDGLAASAPSTDKPPDTTADVLASLASGPPQEDAPPDTADDVLSELAAAAPEPPRPEDPTDDILSGIAGTEPAEQKDDDRSEDVLADLAATGAQAQPTGDDTADVLSGLAELTPPEEAPPETADGILSDLAAEIPDDPEADTSTDAALESLAAVDVPEEVAEDGIDDLLGDLAAEAPDEPGTDSSAEAALESLAAVDVPEEAADDDLDDLLGDLATEAPDEPETDSSAEAALESLAAVDVPEETDEGGIDDLLGDLAAEAPDEPKPDTSADTALESLAATGVPEETDNGGLDDLLGDLAAEAPDEPKPDTSADTALESLAATGVPEETDDGGLDDLLGDLGAEAPYEPETDSSAEAALESLAAVDVPEEAADDDLDDLLGDLATEAPDEPEADTNADTALESLVAADVPEKPDDGGLDDLLGDLAAEAPGEPEAGTGADTALESLAAVDVPEEADDDDIDALLGDIASAPPEEAEPDTLDDLLGDLTTEAPDETGDDLDDLLGDLSTDGPDGIEESETDDLDDLLGDLSTPEGEDQTPDDLDDLLGDGADQGAPAAAAAEAGPAQLSDEPEFAYGVLSADRPAPQKLERKRFRLAILGDFSGRSARGLVETGDDLASRPAILLDPDTVEEVIEGFATELVLPIGKDGAGVAVRLNGLDDLHPDELYENVDLFSELNGLRGQLSAGATAENAMLRLREWGEAHGQTVRPPQSKSAGNAVPSNLKLSEFQKLIGDRTAALAEPSPVADLIARIVGPHVRARPDTEMVAAVDDAISSAMRLILHHPEFQSLEAQWRSIDLVARSIETDDTLDVMLYDISAEEIAADLAAADDLSQSGFARLLTEAPMDEETGRGAYSAMVGLYTFEETPPHAELLGRIARVAAHVDAPFFAAMSPAFLDTPKEDRHPLVAQAWDTLRAMPEAGYIGLASPRFLLRRPYGAKSEPTYEFQFEEFTMTEGMKGMLWANPGLLVAILLARSFRENGPSMNLGSIMSLGEMPYHYVTDRYGDQVALPCTERNLTLDKIETAVQRGYMAVASVKGRDEVRLTSFQSLAGREILGPWSNEPAPPPSPPKPAQAAESDADGAPGEDLDDLLADFGDDLDIGDDPDSGDGDSGDIDADLAALLEDL